MSIYAKIARVQAKLESIPLDGSMEISGNVINYPTKNNIVDLVKKALHDESLVCLQVGLSPSKSEIIVKKDKYGAEWNEIYVEVTGHYEIIDTTDNSGDPDTVTVSWSASAKGGGGKEITLAESACLKSFYINFFNVTMESKYDENHMVNEATHKMDMDALETVMYNKAVYAVKKVTLIKIQRKAKKKGREPKTWDLKLMDINDLTLMITLAMDVMSPAKEENALDGAIEEIENNAT